jgi:hypothetical protein
MPSALGRLVVKTGVLGVDRKIGVAGALARWRERISSIGRAIQGS